ncbi:MAG: FhaA domain-containing protein [Acidimicrobiaceae bacterium]
MFARAYGSAIRPINLGRELLGLIDSMDKSSPINPDFVVNLNATDYAAFADIEKHLTRELAEAATQFAEKKHLKHSAPISVILRVNDAIKVGDFSIINESQPERTSDVLATQKNSNATQPVVATAPLVEAVLVMQSGERIVLETDSLKIGRQATCRIVFNDSNVSREHAQMRRTADGWKLLDLGSTNGTKINGVKITEEQLLVNGDELSFGTSSAKFEIS